MAITSVTVTDPIRSVTVTTNALPSTSTVSAASVEEHLGLSSLRSEGGEVHRGCLAQ